MNNKTPIRKRPSSSRNARRSLRYEQTEDGRIIVGSYWLECRIIGDSIGQVTELAMQRWGAS